MRALPVFGYQDREGHCELLFEDVRVPVTNLLGEEGGGFAIAQARLGPGRIHHCMRCIGMAERALELMCRRVQHRVAFGKTLAEQGVIQEWIADSRIEIDQIRLLTMKAAWLMDTVGNKGARTEISAIKVVAPNVALRVVDRAIQAHGGGGVSDDFPLAAMYAGLRTLRLADGPDEVHRMQLARRELRKYERRALAPTSTSTPRPGPGIGGRSLIELGRSHGLVGHLGDVPWPRPLRGRVGRDHGAGRGATLVDDARDHRAHGHRDEGAPEAPVGTDRGLFEILDRGHHLQSLGQPKGARADGHEQIQVDHPGIPTDELGPCFHSIR